MSFLGRLARFFFFDLELVTQMLALQLSFKLCICFVYSSDYMTYITKKKGKKGGSETLQREQPLVSLWIVAMWEWGQCCHIKLFREVKYMYFLNVK